MELDEGDGFHYLVVRGFAPNTTVDVTVSSTQDGYVSGSASITGTSLQAKVDPMLLSPVTRTADGFRSKVTNWDGGFAYPTEITSPGSVPEGASAIVELDEGDGFHYLVKVPGFAPNATVTVTVGSTQDGVRSWIGYHHWDIVEWSVEPPIWTRDSKRRWLQHTDHELCQWLCLPGDVC